MIPVVSGLRIFRHATAGQYRNPILMRAPVWPVNGLLEPGKGQCVILGDAPFSAEIPGRRDYLPYVLAAIGGLAIPILTAYLISPARPSPSSARTRFHHRRPNRHVLQPSEIRLAFG